MCVAVQGHSSLFLQFGSLIKYFKDVKLERQPATVHHYEGSGIAKVCFSKSSGSLWIHTRDGSLTIKADRTQSACR